MREKILKSDALIVSETDERGIITYANEEFCKISGYSLDELIGKPHNIIRHPDMPKIAFQELWKSVRSGKIWHGFVKNKARDGSYYWVYSTVFPHITLYGDKGYLSCRVKATSHEIEKYSALYQTLH